MKPRTLAALAVTATLAVVPSQASAAKAKKVTLIGSGSVAAQPYFLSLFKAYRTEHPNVRFVYTANGGNVGVKDVQQGKSQFAGQARTPLPSDAGTTYVKGFLDGMVVATNPANKLTSIGLPQLKDIYSGVATNWSSVAGSGLTSTISAFGRDSNGGQYQFFNTAVLGGAAPASRVTPFLSDGLVANAVAKDQAAIGYHGLAWVTKKERVLKINGIAPSAKTIGNQTYPLTRFIFFVLPTTNPNKNVQKFVDWVRTSAAAGKVLTKSGAVPAFNKKK
ncbi:substrate-binding domain-containing protein [Patulibacter sp. NPDC049589]|uniref:substrate-binding domain-containing protein n=1 Tax=Patulibacter sp. NPDC049589 TaxID=3154731 RepID=UPI003433F3F0